MKKSILVLSALVLFSSVSAHAAGKKAPRDNTAQNTAQQAPIQQSPVQQTPAQEIPAQQAQQQAIQSPQQSPIQQSPVQQSSAQQAPASDAVAKAMELDSDDATASGRCWDGGSNVAVIFEIDGKFVIRIAQSKKKEEQTAFEVVRGSAFGVFKIDGVEESIFNYNTNEGFITDKREGKKDISIGACGSQVPDFVKFF